MADNDELVCGDCLHYNTNPQDISQGFCRRFPPAVVAMLIPGPGGAQTQIASTYPGVGVRFGACGEFDDGNSDMDAATDPGHDNLQ